MVQAVVIFSSICVVRELCGPEVGSHWSVFQKSCLFGKKRPRKGKFSKIRSKRIYRNTDPRIVCKFREIWPTGRRWNRALLTWQKTKFRLALSLSLLRHRAHNLPGPAANNVLRAPQISSKSVHFRRSCSRMREHRSNAPQSVSNIRRSYSFFAK